MGLHLNYELRLDASTPESSVRASLAALQAYAATLPFEWVSPLSVPEHAFDAEEAEFRGEMHRIAAIIATPFGGRCETLNKDGVWEQSADDTQFIEDQLAAVGDPSTTIGFLVQPGDGSESAWFALYHCTPVGNKPSQWFFRWHCKTQYASAVSDAHLITCHTSLVRLLDHAKQLGFQVDVHDETFYWETRDESRLLKEVHAMNKIVAAFAGRMSDALGPDKRIEAAIFQHPQFERLEMGEDG